MNKHDRPANPTRSTKKSKARGAPPQAKRGYVMTTRSEQAEVTRQRVLDVAHDLFWSEDYDALTLERVAAGAGVSLPTVLRKFGSKEQLVSACAREPRAKEAELRVVAQGDVRGAARVLAARYEALAGRTTKLLALEARLPAVAEALTRAREVHLAWLATTFAPYLPQRAGPTRTRRLAQLFGATEIYLWWTWREHLGLSVGATERVLREGLEALIEHWRGRTPVEDRAE